MSNPIQVILIGAGNRGYLTFGKFALDNPNLMKFVGVAEPNLERRKRFGRLHDINNENSLLARLVHGEIRFGWVQGSVRQEIGEPHEEGLVPGQGRRTQCETSRSQDG